MLRYSGKAQPAASKANKRAVKTKTVLSDNTISAMDKTFGDSTDYSSLNLNSLGNLEIPPGTKQLFLDSNPIHSLEDLPSLSNLLKLSLKNTNFDTFKGFPSFPSLVEIDIRNTPEIKNTNYKTGLLILIPTLKKINGEIVTRNERKIAESFNPKTSTLLRNGWQPTLHSPNEDEVNHILSRIMAIQKRKSTPLDQTKKSNKIAFAVTLSSKYEKTISSQEEEIKRLEKLIEERKKKLTCKTPKKEKMKEEEVEQQEVEIKEEIDENN